MDETGYGQPNAQPGQPSSQPDVVDYGDRQSSTAPPGLLKTLGVGYTRIRLGYQTPNPTDYQSTPIVCWSCSADGSGQNNPLITGDSWISTMKWDGEIPVVSLLDTISDNDATALVEHFKADGNPVAYWEIGNEPDLSGESPSTYASNFNRVATALRKGDAAIVTADAPIKIGGGTTSWEDSGYLQEFLEDAASQPASQPAHHVDFIDFHFYGATDNATHTATKAELLASMPKITSDLSHLRSIVGAQIPGAQIPIFVGEWNLNSAYNALAYTGFAAAWDADVLGRILTAGAVGEAFGTHSGSMSVLYNSDTGDFAPSGFAKDEPMPIYEALSMFTGSSGLFPHFGTTVVSASSSLAGVDAFASSSPDDIVLANPSSSAKDALVHIANGGDLSAAEWQIAQTGTAPAAPWLWATRSTRNGSFYLNLPPESVTTMVITPPGSTYAEYTLASASNLCLDYHTATQADTNACNATSYQNWKQIGLTLSNGQNGTCLEENSSGTVLAAACNGLPDQDWYSFNSTLFNAQTGHCLAASASGNLTAADCDGIADQNWTWQPAAGAPVIPGGN